MTAHWFTKGHFIEESESQRMTNGFGGRLDFTTDPDFLNHWRERWHPVSGIRHAGGLYVVLFLVSNPMAQEDYTFDLTLKNPAGEISTLATNQVASKHPFILGDSPENVTKLVLCPQFTAIQMDPPDPLGTYTVELLLRDNLTKKSLILRRQFTVEP